MEPNTDSKTHWHEYKAGFCAELEGRADQIAAGKDAPDPLPEVPKFLFNLQQMQTLTREVGPKAAGVPEPDTKAEGPGDNPIDLERISRGEQLEALLLPADSAQKDSSAPKRP